MLIPIVENGKCLISADNIGLPINGQGSNANKTKHIGF